MSDSNWLSGNRGGGIVGSSGSSSSIGTTIESGILRKVKNQQNAATEKSFDDLLIFGYACKIFRDDDKARYIDQGKHLIPWMGDNSLKIDRLIFQTFFVFFFLNFYQTQNKLYFEN